MLAAKFRLKLTRVPESSSKGHSFIALTPYNALIPTPQKKFLFAFLSLQIRTKRKKLSELSKNAVG